MFFGFFKGLELIAIISVKKVIFGRISRINELKIDQKCSDNSHMVSVIMQ